MLSIRRAVESPLTAILLVPVLSAAAPRSVRAQAPYVGPPAFRSVAGAGYANSPTSGFLVTGDSVFNGATPVPINPYLNSTYSFDATNGSTTAFDAFAAAYYHGFWSTGAQVSAKVTNAYYPTADPPSTTPPFGYLVLGGLGSWTQAEFFSPEALTGPYAQMHWSVAGTQSASIGTVNSRLDFRVMHGAASFDDLYSTTDPSSLMTDFGPGAYTYNVPIDLNTPLDFLFWSSAFWQVDANQLQALGSTPTTITANANYADTFQLDSIDLFNGDGTPVTDWTLVDASSGQPLFNAAGRIGGAPVPEPSPLIGLLALTPAIPLLRRRRSR